MLHAAAMLQPLHWWKHREANVPDTALSHTLSDWCSKTQLAAQLDGYTIVEHHVMVTSPEQNTYAHVLQQFFLESEVNANEEVTFGRRVDT